MLRNFETLVSDLKLKSVYENTIEKNMLELQDIQAELSCDYKSPSYYEEYIKVDGNKDTWIPPRTESPVRIDSRRSKLNELLNRIEKENILLQYRLEELKETMDYIKIKNEFLYKILLDSYCSSLNFEQVYRKYFYSNKGSLYKSMKRMFYRIF